MNIKILVVKHVDHDNIFKYVFIPPTFSKTDLSNLTAAIILDEYVLNDMYSYGIDIIHNKDTNFIKILSESIYFISYLLYNKYRRNYYGVNFTPSDNGKEVLNSSYLNYIYSLYSF